MKLYHVSEESDIELFHPRTPTRADLQSSPPLVWAINERCLPNFMTPRDCPRVTYHANDNTTVSDIRRYFSSNMHHVVAIEQGWYRRMCETALYVYEFSPENFYLQDDAAGYYVSEQSETPIGKTCIQDLFGELFRRGIEVRIIPELRTLCEEIQQTSMNWSMCRMKNA